jgi:hypothetical protein
MKCMKKYKEGGKTPAKKPGLVITDKYRGEAKQDQFGNTKRTQNVGELLSELDRRGKQTQKKRARAEMNAKRNSDKGTTITGSKGLRSVYTNRNNLRIEGL